MFMLPSRCESCGRWMPLLWHSKEVVDWDESRERTARYPVKRYRRVRDFLRAELTESSMRYGYKVRMVRTCRHCGASKVRLITREATRPISQMPSSCVVDPLGEVTTWHQPDGTIRVKATILSVPTIPGARTGLAIDASVAAEPLPGGPRSESVKIETRRGSEMDLVVRPIATRLSAFSSSGNTDVIHWGFGADGSEIRDIGHVNAASARNTGCPVPETRMAPAKALPAIKHFVESAHRTAQWSLIVLVTDGRIGDLPDVQRYSVELAGQMASGARTFVKFVVIGVGESVDIGHLQALDDLDYGEYRMPSGEPIDLWDYKLANEMRTVDEIFSEVVSANVMLAPSAKILDDKGAPVSPIGRSSFDNGLPGLLEFTMPAGSTAFTIVWSDGRRISQSLPRRSYARAAIRGVSGRETDSMVTEKTESERNG